MNRDELILSCENCVKNLVRKYNNGCNDEDLQSTGVIAVIECVDRCLAENMTDIDSIQARCNVWAKNRILDEIYKEKIKYADDNAILDEIEAPEDLSQLIMDVRHDLTDRQLEVFDLLLQGKSPEEIQEELNIGDMMFYKHCRNIREKIKGRG